MTRTFHPRTVFILGVVALAIVFALMIIIGDAFNISFFGLNTTEDKSIKENISTGAQVEDPLVTVVPKDVRAGYPQPLPTDPKRGATDPKVVIMEFGDFECPDCRTMDEAIRQVLVEYPDSVQHVWKDFPLPTEHPYAESAAIAARCAGEQGKFWEMYDVLFENQGLFVVAKFTDFAAQLNLNVDQFSACLQSTDAKALVVQGYFIARSFSLTQTPTLFINKTPVEGVQTVDQLRKLVQDALK